MPDAVILPGVLRRWMRIAVRVGVGAVVLLALLCCGLRVYSVRLAHREVSLLAEAGRIRIGASEASILPIVARYGGVKEMSPPIATDDCPAKGECESENARISDYDYNVGLSVFDLFSRYPPKGRLGRALAYLMYRTSSFWREPLSLRDSIVDVSIDIRRGRVEAVHGGLFVEGRTGWLGNIWDVARDLPRLDMGSRAYAVGGASLSFPPSGGAGTTHFLTPSATPEQFEAAQSFNADCLTGLVPCRCLRDLSPRAFQYLDGHPDAGDVIQLEECPNPVWLGR